MLHSHHGVERGGYQEPGEGAGSCRREQGCPRVAMGNAERKGGKKNQGFDQAQSRMVGLSVRTDLFHHEMLFLLLKNENVHFAWLKSQKEQGLGERGS